MRFRVQFRKERDSAMFATSFDGEVINADHWVAAA
jgi:hypothetical protein